MKTLSDLKAHAEKHIGQLTGDSKKTATKMLNDQLRGLSSENERFYIMTLERKFCPVSCAIIKEQKTIKKWFLKRVNGEYLIELREF